MATHVPHASQARRSFYAQEDDEDVLSENKRNRRKIRRRICSVTKIIFFVIIWISFTILLTFIPPHVPQNFLIPLEPEILQTVKIDEEPSGNLINLKLMGCIDEDASANSKLARVNQTYVSIVVEWFNDKVNETKWKSRGWDVYLDPNLESAATIKKFIDIGGPVVKPIVALFRPINSDGNQLRLSFLSKHDRPTALHLDIDINPINSNLGVVYSILLLAFLYILIIWDIADRTFAAMLAATLAIGILTFMGSRPSVEKIVSWIDMHSLMLLFGMMVMVAILSETGLFDYMSVVAYRLSKGQPWYLVFLLCMLTVALSSALDNVTIVMLMVPVAVRLSECMGMRTTTVIVIIAIFSNIGGALTPVGDPPNVIIATNPYVMSQGVNFITFVMHMFPCVFFSIVIIWFLLYKMMKTQILTGGEEQMRESLRTLTKHVAKFNAPTASEEELRREILKRIEELKERYRRKQELTTYGALPNIHFIETLAEMQAKYKIKNKPLLVKCCIALGFAILLFSTNSVPFMQGITLSWAAILAAILLLILVNKPDMDVILAAIEWSTLLFFAALFVLIEAISEMGLIEWVGDRTTEIILSVNEKHRIIVAIMLMLWISALFSAVVDNIPIVTMMLKLAIKLASNRDLKVPLLPLLWALSFGVCYGGNSTLIAATSNVVAAGIAKQYGYTITFIEFFKYGFPAMIVTDLIATVYLLVAHGVFMWH